MKKDHTQVAHHPSTRNRSDKRRKITITRSDDDGDDDDDRTHKTEEDDNDNGEDKQQQHELIEEADDDDDATNTNIKIDRLGFEILDIIFSYFSSSSRGLGSGGNTNNTSLNASSATRTNQSNNDNDAGGLSHYENQLNLLNFCQVSKGFYIVARLHLSRFIPIASTFKARQVLSLCSSSSSSSSSLPSSSIPTSSNSDTFESRVHSLLLHWPDQGKYSTRRSSVITHYEFIQLLSSFPSLRGLELVHLPYTSLDPFTSSSSSSSSSSLNYATLASMAILDNVRSLNLSGSPYNLRNEEFDTVFELLSLFKRLENLEILNVPLNALAKITELPPPSYSLKSLSIKISSPRRLEPSVLEWMLENTIQAKSCKSLTVWLSKKCSDIYHQDFNHPSSSNTIKEDEGFKGLEISLSKLSPSLTHLSLLGLRAGQSNKILENTSEKLERLTLYDTFGFGNDLLGDLPTTTGLKVLEMLDNPSVAFGRVPPAEDTMARRTNVNHPRNAGVANASTTVPASSRSASTSASNTNPADTLASTIADDTNANNNNNIPTTFIEIPISSHSFISELGPHNRLSNLKLVVIPENARFGKRGRWLNKELIKACRRVGVRIEEVPA